MLLIHPVTKQQVKLKSDKYERITYEKKKIPNFAYTLRNFELTSTTEEKGLGVMRGGSVKTSARDSAVIKTEIENCQDYC